MTEPPVPSQPPRWRRTGSRARPVVVLVIVTALGFLLYLATRWVGEVEGTVLFLGVPAAVGVVLGLYLSPRVWLLVIGLPLVLTGMLWGLESAGVHGAACVAMLGLVFLVPMIVGAGVGALVGWLVRRRRPKMPRRVQDVFALLVVLSPLLLQQVEDAFPPVPEVVTVRTEHRIDAAPREVWRNLLFYEEVDGELPLLLRIGMPVPLRAEGSKAAVGDRARCLYTTGRLEKIITERLEARRLAFRVVEQRIHFEHDLRLRGGSFDLAPDGDGTRLSLTTRYETLVYPGFVWRPLEAWVLRTLHEHVAGGIRRAAEHAHTARR